MADKQLVRFYDSLLIKEAELALERATSAKASGDSSSHGGASFTAIVGATCATEAYLSEVLAHLAEKKFITSDERDEIRRKNGLWSKYNALATKFNGSLHEEPIYNEFQALVHLRNAIVHRSADYLEPGVWPDKVAPYKDVIPHVAGDGLDWTSQVYDADTAAWAVGVAKEFLQRIDDYVPDPGRQPFIDPGASA